MAHYLSLGLCVLSAIAWTWGAYAVWRTGRDVPKLSEDRSPEPAEWPLVSLIIAARNEEAEVEAALRARLADGYPALEVVVVDDRSDDRTGAILDAIAADEPRVKVIHLDALPEGWLGKLYAMHRGIEASSGEWVLLSDADVHFAPGTLRRALAACVSHRLDHFAALPTFRSQRVFLDAVIDVFGRNLIIAGRLWAVSDPASDAAVGGGLFNLFRRAHYDRTPGLPWLKLEVADDVALAQMLKDHGGRTTVFDAQGWVSLDFYSSVRSFVVGVEKNSFAVLGRYSVVRLTLTCLLLLAIDFGWIPSLALPWPAARLLGALTCAAMFATSAVAVRRMGRKVRHVPLLPFATVVFVYASMRAGFMALWRGGVMWRGTLYDTASLRAGSRLRIP